MENFIFHASIYFLKLSSPTLPQELDNTEQRSKGVREQRSTDQETATRDPRPRQCCPCTLRPGGRGPWEGTWFKVNLASALGNLEDMLLAFARTAVHLMGSCSVLPRIKTGPLHRTRAMAGQSHAHSHSGRTFQKSIRHNHCSLQMLSPLGGSIGCWKEKWAGGQRPGF